MTMNAAIATGAALGAISTLLANVQKARASAPPAGVDPAVWEMMLNSVEATAVQQGQVEQLTQAINQLTSTMGGTPSVGESEDPFANMPLSETGTEGKGFTTGQVVCDVINQGFQLPKTPIPKNKQLVIKGHPGNVGWVYLAVQRAQSQLQAVAYILLPNEGVGLFIRNADQVWVSAQTLNDGIVFIVEQS